MHSVAHVYPGDLVTVEVPLSMRIEDHSTFIQQLYLIWQQQSRPVPISQEHTLEIITWYVDGHYVPSNDQHRPVVLGDDFNDWEADIRRAWHDLEDPSLPIDFVFVQPVPPPHPVGQVYILALQKIPATSRATVVTMYDDAYRQCAPYSAAVLVSASASKRDIIESAGKTADCSTLPGVTCSVWHWGRELTDNRDFRAENGFGFNLLIHRPFLHGWDDAEANNENVLMQIDSTSVNAATSETGVCSALDAVAPSFFPTRRNLWDHSDFVNNLHTIWRKRAAPQQDGSVVIQVATWYLAPGREIHRCLHSRQVTLAEDFTQWETLMRSAWSDIDHQQLPIDFALVYPEPPFLEPVAAVHILLVQQPIEAATGCLVTIFDAAVTADHRRQAVIVNEAIRFENVLALTGYHLIRADFTLTHALMPIKPGFQVVGRDGAALNLQVHRNFLPAASPDVGHMQFLQLHTILQQNPHASRHFEDPSLLQQGNSPNPDAPSFVPSEPQYASAPEFLRIDFGSVKQALERLDFYLSHIFDVEHVLQDQAHWLPQCLPRIRSDWYAYEGPVERISI